MPGSEIIRCEIGDLGYEQLVQLPTILHKRYSQGWREVYGHDFHNNKHVNAVSEARSRYLRNCTKDKDPLRVYEGITIWNQENPELAINYWLFRKISELFSVWHDTGNFAYDINFNRGVQLNTFEVYTPGIVSGDNGALDAEDRSGELFIKALSNSNINRYDKDRYEKLVPYLIGLSRFTNEVPEEKPFALFVAVIDQIGNAVVNEDPDKLRGLVTELGVAAKIRGNDELQVSPNEIVHFVGERIDQLLDGRSDLLLQMLGEELPNYPDFGKEGKKETDWREVIQFLEKNGI